MNFVGIAFWLYSATGPQVNCYVKNIAREMYKLNALLYFWLPAKDLSTVKDGYVGTLFGLSVGLRLGFPSLR